MIRLQNPIIWNIVLWGNFLSLSSYEKKEDLWNCGDTCSFYDKRWFKCFARWHSFNQWRNEIRLLFRNTAFEIIRLAQYRYKFNKEWWLAWKINFSHSICLFLSKYNGQNIACLLYTSVAACFPSSLRYRRIRLPTFRPVSGIYPDAWSDNILQQLHQQ